MRRIAKSELFTHDVMATPSKHEALAQVETICKSEMFARVSRNKEVLRYLVRAAFDDVRAGGIKESVIGVEVFGLPASYDPKKISKVRVLIGELRNKLREYYETEGRFDGVVIAIPLGSYIPKICYPGDQASLALNDEAALLVWNARAAFDQRTLTGHDAAFRYVDRALGLHPDHPRLLSLKAMVHAARAMYGRHPRTELEAAQELVQRVGAQGSRVWECRFAEAQIVSVLYWNWQRAQELYEQAIVLSHGEARYMSWYAAFLASQLRAEEAVAIMREAVSHFAHDVAVTRADMAFYQIVSGRLGEAEETLRSTLELFLNVHYIPYLHTAILREARGDFAGAAAAIQQVPMTPAEGTIIAGARYMFTGLAGDREDAERGYQSLQAQRQSDSEFIPASQVAMAALGTGNRDAAATWFEAAADERDPLLYLFGVLPFMRHLYSQPRFQSLMRETLKLGFGWQAQKKLA